MTMTPTGSLFVMLRYLFFVALPLPLLGGGRVTATTDGVGDNEQLIPQIIDWARENGAYISDKVQVQSLGEDLSGMFAIEPLPKGFVLSSVPWHLLIQPEKPQYYGWCDAVWAAHAAITKDAIEQTPYEKYLATKSRSHVPAFWSKAGQNMLKELIGEYLPTLRFDIAVERTFIYHCGEDPKEVAADERILDALMLAMTRAEGPELDNFIPFHDLINHRNGKWTNTEIRIVYETGNGFKRGYSLVVTRNVKAGEQLLSSYNQCPWCQMYSNPKSQRGFFTTPQMFEQYGFVELYPQRWVIPQVRLMFDIDYKDNKDEGKNDKNGSEVEEQPLEVHFQVTPSARSVEFLQYELLRLAAFEQKYNKNNQTVVVPDHELRSIWEYHNAIVTAFTHAHKSPMGQISEEIWNVRRNWYREEEV